MKHGLAVLLTYLNIISDFAAIIILAGEPLLADLQKLTDTLLKWHEEIYRTWPKGNDFQKMISGQLPPRDDSMRLRKWLRLLQKQCHRSCRV